MAINDALSMVEETGNLPVPLHLRNAPTKLMKQLNYGKNYKYSHNYENNFVEQEFMPEKLKGRSIWKPQNNATESKLKEFLHRLWKNRFN